MFIIAKKDKNGTFYNCWDDSEKDAFSEFKTHEQAQTHFFLWFQCSKIASEHGCNDETIYLSEYYIVEVKDNQFIEIERCDNFCSY